MSRALSRTHMGKRRHSVQAAPPWADIAPCARTMHHARGALYELRVDDSDQASMSCSRSAPVCIQLVWLPIGLPLP